ncbi:MAG: polyprenyl synthetase family protein [Gammaproteobacteria bacterium]|nr:polyprenyl synthetase family protein [Gammaproteobacteria bacterium]
MSIDRIRACVADDLQATDQLILTRLSSDVALINQIGHHIIQSGGKRVRPLMLLLAAKACGYQGTHHHTMAAVVEFIHTSTLLHDDVVDEADTRRGKATANANWGNAASVLVGDFLYSRSFQLMVEPQNLRILSIMAETTNVIAAGEVLQLLNCRDADTDSERYFQVIYRKTAKLFEASAQLGAVLALQDAAIESALACYGKELGNAYQLIDDVLDYSADESELGKALGKDLAEGKPTLPLILALARAEPEEQQLIRHAIEQGSDENLTQITSIIQRTGALTETQQQALAASDRAIAALSPLLDSPYKTALIDLAHLAVNRSH